MRHASEVRITVNWWLLICGFLQAHELRSSRQSTPVDNQRHEQGTVNRVRASSTLFATQSPLRTPTTLSRVPRGSAPEPSALHPFCSGVAPHNGCIASGSSPAHQSTRNGDNAEVLLMHVGNRRGQPQQRSRASHRSADGHHSCLSTSSTGERSQGHRTTHGCTSTHSLHRMAAVNGATTGTNTPVEHSVASLGSVTSRLAGRPHEPRPSPPTLSPCGQRPGLTAAGPHPCSARTRPTTFAEAGAPDRRDHRATTSETSMDGSTSSAVDRASASTPDEATTVTCRIPA